MTVRVEVNAAAALRAVGRVAQKLQQIERPLAMAGLYKERRTKQQFASQSDPDGAPWAPLRPSTLRRKKTRAILRETGSLAASIAMVASGRVVRIVAGTSYGLYHQTGTSKMPQRKILGWSDEDISRVTQIFEEYLSG